ncbi:hypothetical protein MADE_000001022475 [Alteromonas mediterranea DE]|uniref:Uncharacterized protein n=1 Tax=Alteromonas mediterranea (strain DSM 17117 / CIP 110805 / LMG 28347 / Deep ecotype) TaxID=1774373 RepID=T2DMG7_ALTMD|nr:hypothetical protein MADE_000001022475 [Alteromonas mediterranea DE]
MRNVILPFYKPAKGAAVMKLSCPGFYILILSLSFIPNLSV